MSNDAPVVPIALGWQTALACFHVLPCFLPPVLVPGSSPPALLSLPFPFSPLVHPQSQIPPRSLGALGFITQGAAQAPPGASQAAAAPSQPFDFETLVAWYRPRMLLGLHGIRALP